MSTNLIPIKAFLGKYYSELNYSSIQDKYKNTKLDTFFDQRFYIQNNKVQMIVDPGLSGLMVSFCGNEIHISKELYDHPNMVITNSIENTSENKNPRSLYNPEIFSTLAYLVCQNHTMFQIIGEIDEPIYVKYRSDYETFYNSIVLFEVISDISVEIVEEIESCSALNTVTNYILHSNSNIKLTTFYQNHLSGISFLYRNVIAQEKAIFNHILFGKGSSNVIDESKVLAYNESKSEFLGVVNSDGKNFHSILSIQPAAENYYVDVDYRGVLFAKADITFFPVILGQDPLEKAKISVTNITLEEIPSENIESVIKGYVGDIVDRAILERMAGAKRFYENKTKFLHFP
jgi:hypothetical protein